MMMTANIQLYYTVLWCSVKPKPKPEIRFSALQTQNPACQTCYRFSFSSDIVVHIFLHIFTVWFAVTTVCAVFHVYFSRYYDAVFIHSVFTTSRFDRIQYSHLYTSHNTLPLRHTAVTHNRLNIQKKHITDLLSHHPSRLSEPSTARLHKWHHSIIVTSFHREGINSSCNKWIL